MPQNKRNFEGCAKRMTAALFLPLVLALTAVAVPRALAAEKVVRVNDEVLTELDLNLAMQKILPAATFHGGITPDKRVKYRDEAVALMIEEELYYQEAKRLGMEVEKEKIEKVKESTVERLGGKKNFRKALEQYGQSDREYERKIEKRLLVEKFIKEEIDRKSEVSDGEARDHYRKNKKSFKRPEARRVRHILVKAAPNAPAEEWGKAKARAEEALEKIRNGVDFADVAWNYSMDPYRVKGGDLGLLHKGRLEPELEREVWKLKKGQLSGVIKTIYGYHVVRVEEITEPEQLKFDDVRESIKRKLQEKKREKLEENLLGRLRKKADIEVY